MAGIPQVITEDRASGAQFIDGGLKFDGSKGQYLKFTPSSSGNRRTQTLSVWIKNAYTGGNNKMILGGGDNASGPRYNIAYNPTKQFGVTQNPTGSTNANTFSAGVFRDYSRWQHLVVSLDCTVGANSGQARIYVNGKLQDNAGYGGGNAAYISDQDGIFNTINKRMYLGHYAANPSDPAEFDGHMSQFYWIDGLAIGPGYFGYTDPLTGTWRPKKFRAEGTTVNDGTDWSGSTTNLTNGPNGFNGNLGNYAEVSSSGAKGTVTFPKSIKVENSVTFWYSSGQPGNLFINDETTAMEVTGSFHQQHIEFTGTLSSVSIQSASQPAIWGIAVDGTILESTVTQNLDFGTNGVYLPFDGNTPIGQDQSGKGNNWTPVKFGGSNSPEKATGAIPILNTNGGGTVARSGVRTDKKTYTVTASGGKYYLDGVETPTLNFLRGGTYIFDYTGATSHPFKFSTTSDGTHGGGSEYTDGTNTSTTNVMKITVPHNAPDTLYYYCSAHSGMGSSINVTTDESKADLYASSCIFAAPFIGNSLDVSDQINVTSAQKSNHLSDVGVTYDTTATSTNFYNSYGVYAPGGGTSQKVVYSDSEDFNLDGPFTIEFFIKMNSDTNCTIICDDGVNGDPQVKYTSTNDRIQLQSSNVNIELDENYNTALHLSDGNWHHVAFTRSAVNDTNAIYLFIDGVAQTLRARQNSASSSVNFNRMSLFTGAVGRFPGYLQDLRIYKGVAKYTSNFIPASTNPDVLPDTPSGITGKTNLAKITDGAVSFDGSGDYLSGPAILPTSTGTAFVVDCFWYSNGNSSQKGIWEQHSGGSGRTGYFANNGSAYLVSEGNTIGTFAYGDKKWYFTRIIYDGSGNIYHYVDGVLIGSGTQSSGIDDTGFQIGAYSTDSFNGFISNFRIVVGSNSLSGTDVPTAPLTNITNTALLCCQSTTSAAAAAVSPNISGINDGTVWSSYFTGNHDTTHGWGTLYKSSNAFDGNLSSAAIGQVDAVGLTWTAPGGGIGASATTIRIYGNDDNCPDDYLKINGINYGGLITQGFGPDWTVLKGAGAVGAGITQLESVYLRDNSAGNQHYRWRALEIDGTVIVDPLAANGDAAATNSNPFTDDINTIKGQETGYANFNPLLKGANTTLSNGNLTVSSSGGTFDGFTTGTILIPKTGKWFVEFTAGSLPSSTYYGMYNTRTWNPNGFSGTGFFGLQVDTGNKFKSTGSGAYMPAVSVRDVVGVMYDADNNTLGFMRNGINYGVAFDNSDSIDYTDYHRVWWNTNGSTSIPHTINFGQKPFKFPPPDGFQPLSLSNVQPEKVIARPDQYVSATLFTGTGDAVSSRTVELPHAADLVWAKSRDRASSHQIADTVRGNNSVLQSNANMTARNPTTQYSGGGVSTIDGKTITIASGTSNNANLNTDNNKGVIWSWKAGGSSNTFNIDDVGYANASDVNMNVGVFNSSTFLKGQVWSGLMSPASGSFDQAASRAFDGFLRTDPNRLRTSGNQVTVTMNLSSSPVTVSSQIKVHAEPGYNSSCTVTVGGVTYTSSTGSLHTFNVSGSLTQMTLQSTQSGGRTYMEGMEIDGKLLVDDNVTINAPSIAPTGCSVGTKQGFSIVAYNATGSNLRVSHGLSERPGLIILKTVHSTTGDWLVWHQSLAGVDRFLKLNDTITQAQADNVFLSIDENTFGTGDDSGINSNGQQKIAYLWHDVPGLQKFGKWTNNNSNDGAFIELGFRPALILLKNTDNVEKWYWIDSSRHTYNEVAPSNNAAGAVNTLQPNTSNTEATSRGSHTNTTVDILSNGFKIRTTNPASGEISFGTRNYIYAAWAEAPSINLYGAQANAR